MGKIINNGVEYGYVINGFVAPEKYRGNIISYTGVCPEGYLPCDGTTYTKTQYSDLYDFIKENFGNDYIVEEDVSFKVPSFGDGSTLCIKYDDYAEAAGSGSSTDTPTSSTGGAITALYPDNMLPVDWLYATVTNITAYYDTDSDNPTVTAVAFDE